MPICPSCQTDVPGASRFCPACGTALPTLSGPLTGAFESPVVSTSLDSDSSDGRFPPGTLVARRYRIVALLGQGGMGEVYRADDLKLGQSVALKFLPAALIGRADRLEKLHAEVRLARQVSHPNVCRVYDVGEADGQTFLTMEFIDGQDLAGLLRQAGRLPEDRGIELARQLCLGLAAAHDRGIIHRDLKPQNVMIDGRGQVRITDFGLAVLAGTTADVGSGTPAYMAPEQLAGKEVSAQSDLYALGLIFHEIFTGKRVYDARSPEELRKLHADSTPSKPSSHVIGLNPAIERAILRCLERDPKDRPRSAYEVLVALPGGDPLAAALAAGETPSPEMVAEASLGADFSPRAAVALLAAILVGLIALPFLREHTSLVNRLPMQDSPEVLRHKARTILRQLNIGDEDSADSAWGMQPDRRGFEHWRAAHQGDDWNFLATGQPAVLYFWYRQSPAHLTQRESPPDPWTLKNEPGYVTPTRPGHTVPGMASVFLDVRGRLIELIVVPPEQKPGAAPGTTNWRSGFDAAGLELVRFEPVEPMRRPPVYADEVKAWIGVYPDQPSIPLRVEAAACFGKIVYFHLAPANQTHAPPRGIDEATEDTGIRTWVAIVTCAILTVGSWLAWRNIRRGKANLSGAWRLSLFFLSASVLSWLVMAHHSWSFFDELWGLIAPIVGRSVVFAGMIWIMYVALEPYARQRWPWRMVGWSRLLVGRWRDPLLGRDILIGAAGAILYRALHALGFLAPSALGWRSEIPAILGAETLSHPAFPVAIFLLRPFQAMVLFFYFWLVGLIVRKDWLTASVWIGVGFAFTLAPILASGWQAAAVFTLASSLAIGAITVIILIRYGLLAFACFCMFNGVFEILPVTANGSVWYASVGIAYLLFLAGVAIGACVIALDGRAPFGKDWMQDT